MINRFKRVLQRFNEEKIRLLRSRFKTVSQKKIEYVRNRINSVNKSYRKEIFRKSIHLSSLWIPGLIYFTHQGISIVIFSILFAIDALLEYGNYKRWGWARKIFGRLFFKTLRQKETKRIYFQSSGSLYVLLAAIACTMLFTKPVAAISMTVMLISDTFAALIGKAFGTRRIYKNKSLEGTSAFFMSALFICMFFEPIYHFTYASVIACLLATMAEVYEDKTEIDDNLSIPLSIGIILSFLG